MAAKKKQTNTSLEPSFTESAATLTAATVEKEFQSLYNNSPRAMRSPHMPEYNEADGSWALAAAMAMFAVLRVQINERPYQMTTGQSPTEMQLTFPLGKNSFTSGSMISLESLYEKDGVHIQDMKYRICQELFYNSFQGLAQWVDIAKNAKKYTVNDILKIKDIEQRMAAMRIFGPEKLIEEAGATLLNKSKRGNELYLIPRERGLFEEDAYFLKYQCVSTGRIYVSGVPGELFNLANAVRDFAVRRESDMTKPGFGMRWITLPVTLEEPYRKQYPKACWADLGMAWKFRLSYEEYCSLTRENEG